MVNTYIVNGFNDPNNSIKNIKSIIKRDNLTVVPEIIQYETYEVDEIKVFTNKIGSRVTIQPLGYYKNPEEALKDFYTNNNADSSYNKSYALLKKHVLDTYGIIDSDWNMLLFENQDELEYANNNISQIYVINNFDIDDYLTYGFLDCALIYQSVYYIKEFMGELSSYNFLSKSQSFFIGYYMSLISKVIDPSTFLVNKNELDLYKEIYSAWDLDVILRNNINNIYTTIEVLNFTWNNNKENRNKLSTFLLTILTLILGGTSLYSFFESTIVKNIIIIFFSSITSILFILFMIELVKYIIDSIEYKKKIQK